VLVDNGSTDETCEEASRMVSDRFQHRRCDSNLGTSRSWNYGITDGFDNRAMMSVHCLLDDPIMHVQQPQHPPFVRAHLPAKADDVGEHDRGQTASLGPWCL